MNWNLHLRWFQNEINWKQYFNGGTPTSTQTQSERHGASSSTRQQNDPAKAGGKQFRGQPEGGSQERRPGSHQELLEEVETRWGARQQSAVKQRPLLVIDTTRTCRMTVVRSWKQILLLLKTFRTNLESQSRAAVDCVFGSTCSGQVGPIFWGIHERRCESAPPLGWPLLSGQVDLLSLSPETSCLKEQHQTFCSSLGFILTYIPPSLHHLCDRVVLRAAPSRSGVSRPPLSL